MYEAALGDYRARGLPRQHADWGNCIYGSVGDAAPLVEPDDSLRRALNLLLAGGYEALAVHNADGKPVGEITLACLRRLSVDPAAEAAEAGRVARDM